MQINQIKLDALKNNLICDIIIDSERLVVINLKEKIKGDIQIG